MPRDVSTRGELCAFCGCTASGRRQLIAGPTNVCICSECVVFAYRALEATGDVPRDTDVDTQSPVFAEEITGVRNVEELKLDGG